MDIARPEKKRQRRRRQFLSAAVALVLVITSLLIFWPKRIPLQHQYVTLTHDGRNLRTLVVSPKAVSSKLSVVILVHEVYGLSDWATHFADELAEQGFIVIAPDLLSGYGPSGGGYDAFASDRDRASEISTLDHSSVMADLDAVADFAKTMPNANGKIAVTGFSWGGWKTFAFATHRKDLTAVFVFYGTGPNDVASITAPVYGFYAGKDSDVTFTVPETENAMKAAGKFYEPVTYQGADHGFMRLGEDPIYRLSANRTAHNQAFARLVQQLRQMSSNQAPPR